MALTTRVFYRCFTMNITEGAQLTDFLLRGTKPGLSDTRSPTCTIQGSKGPQTLQTTRLTYCTALYSTLPSETPLAYLGSSLPNFKPPLLRYILGRRTLAAGDDRKAELLFLEALDAEPISYGACAAFLSVLRQVGVGLPSP